MQNKQYLTHSGFIIVDTGPIRGEGLWEHIAAGSPII